LARAETRITGRVSPSLLGSSRQTESGLRGETRHLGVEVPHGLGAIEEVMGSKVVGELPKSGLLDSFRGVAKRPLQVWSDLGRASDPCR
jgi:hypothetical protein